MVARSKQTHTRREPKPASHAVNGHAVPLRSLTEQALDSYFATLNGHAPGHLYDLVMREVEEPLVPRGARLLSRQPEPRRRHPRHQSRHFAQETPRLRHRRLKPT